MFSSILHYMQYVLAFSMLNIIGCLSKLTAQLMGGSSGEKASSGYPGEGADARQTVSPSSPYFSPQGIRESGPGPETRNPPRDRPNFQAKQPALPHYFERFNL